MDAVGGADSHFPQQNRGFRLSASRKTGRKSAGARREIRENPLFINVKQRPSGSTRGAEPGFEWDHHILIFRKILGFASFLWKRRRQSRAERSHPAAPGSALSPVGGLRPSKRSAFRWAAMTILSDRIVRRLLTGCRRREKTALVSTKRNVRQGRRQWGGGARRDSQPVELTTTNPQIVRNRRSEVRS